MDAFCKKYKYTFEHVMKEQFIRIILTQYLHLLSLIFLLMWLCCFLIIKNTQTFVAIAKFRDQCRICFDFKSSEKY